MKYILWMNERSSGPYDKSQIAELLSNGKITGQTEYLPEDRSGYWQPIRMAPDLLDLLDGVDPPNKETHFVWQFFGSLMGGILLIGAAVGSYRICNWIWAWGEKPWYEVPEWVHDFGWIVALALCIAGLVAGLAGIPAIIWPFGELSISAGERTS